MTPPTLGEIMIKDLNHFEEIFYFRNIFRVAVVCELVDREVPGGLTEGRGFWLSAQLGMWVVAFYLWYYDKDKRKKGPYQ
jgi:hypothetical protein